MDSPRNLKAPGGVIRPVFFLSLDDPDVRAPPGRPHVVRMIPSALTRESGRLGRIPRRACLKLTRERVDESPNLRLPAHVGPQRLGDRDGPVRVLVILQERDEESR